MTDPFRSILLTRITPSPTNPRKRFDEAKLAELAESIKSQGVIQPVVVRALDIDYELVAGERRFRAAALAGLEEIPAIIRELSDADVLEIQVLENAQREDVHPLEECLGFKRILDSGMYGTGIEAIELLAGKLGKSASFVYQRLKLASLTEKAQADFLDGLVTAGHAVMIARLQPVDQKKALVWMLDEARYDNGWTTGRTSGTIPSVKALANWIGSNVTRKLSTAPWKFQDSELLPRAGSCADCAKRTGAEGKLFDDGDKSDRCLDASCFKDKLEAFRLQKIARAKAEHPDAPLVATQIGGHAPAAGVLKIGSHAVKDKPFEGAVPVIVVDSNDSSEIGEVKYMRRTETSSAAVGSDKDPAERKARLEELRLQRAENLARHRIYETCLVAIERGAIEHLLAGSLAQVVLLKALDLNPDQAYSGTKYTGPRTHELLQPFGIDTYSVREPSSPEKLPESGSVEMGKLALGMCVQGEILYNDMQKPSCWALEAFAKFLGVDVKGIRKQSDFDCLSKKQQTEVLAARKKAEEAVPAAEAAEGPPKRGRGRPPKPRPDVCPQGEAVNA